MKFKQQKDELKHLQHVMSDHQANEALANQLLSKPKAKPKLKVISGSTASKPRISVDHVEPLSQKQLEQRRQYSHFTRSSKINELLLRRDAEIYSLFKKHADIVD